VSHNGVKNFLEEHFYLNEINFSQRSAQKGSNQIFQLIWLQFGGTFSYYLVDMLFVFLKDL